MIRGYNPRCVEGSKKSLKSIEEQREIDPVMQQMIVALGWNGLLSKHMTVK